MTRQCAFARRLKRTKSEKQSPVLISYTEQLRNCTVAQVTYNDEIENVHNLNIFSIDFDSTRYTTAALHLCSVTNFHHLCLSYFNKQSFNKQNCNKVSPSLSFQVKSFVLGDGGMHKAEQRHRDI